MKKLFFSLLVAGSIAFTTPTAGAVDFRDFFLQFQEGVRQESVQVDPEAEELILPTYQEDLRGEDGVAGILAVVKNLLNFIKLVVAPIVVLVMMALGVRMVLSGRDHEQVYTKFKTYLTYFLEGLIMIFIADALVNVIFGAEGQVFIGGRAGAVEQARQTGRLLEGVINLIQVIIGSLAVFSLVTAGMRYVITAYDDDQIAEAKKQITWSLAGLFVVGISEFLVKRVLFVDQGRTLGIQAAKELIAQITNFVAGTMGTLAFVAMIYAGVLYVTARDQEDNISKAKSILFWAAIGLILAGAAFAVTTTIVELDSSQI